MKTSDVILIILALASLGMAVWYFIGDSPTFEQSLLVLVITLLFKMQSDTNYNKSQMKNFKKSFSALAKDFKTHIKHK